ncbi:MAG: TolC family protein [Casimicrobium sp.]
MFLLSSAQSQPAAPRFRHLLTITVTTLAAAFACAQTPLASTPTTGVLTLSEAFRLSLAAQPWQAALDERAREQEARLRVTDSWLADQPTISSGLRAGNREGLREYEVEISAPIATATRRNLLSSTARGEAGLYRATVAQQRLKLASEVRVAYWAALLAETELAIAKDEAMRAALLAADSARRTAAGESARVETLQAQTALQTAQSNVLEVESRLEVAKQILRALVGDAGLRALSDASEVRTDADQVRNLLREHPTLKVGSATTAAARAKLNEASNLVNAAPSVSFTLANERTNSSASSTTARIGISIPFGGTPRAAPRIAQANAELIESQASEPLAQQQLRSEFESAQRSLSAIEKRIDVLAERTRLATEVAELYAKAYRLGELDLPTRLRAEGERANATLALARARIEQKHAISRVNQSLGILP